MLMKKHSSSEDPIIRNMIAFMHEKFNKYWECDSVIFSMAIILDPRYKLEYVESAFGYLGIGIYDDVKEKLESLFDECKGYTDNASLLASQDMIIGDGSQEVDGVDKDFEDNEKRQGNKEDKSQLDVYLSKTSLPRNQKLDILEYWKSNYIKWPELSLMAKDIMSIPLTTVVSESSFSYGGKVINKLKTSILPKNVEARVCTSDWLKASEENEESDSDSDNEEGAGISTNIQRLIGNFNDD